MVGSHLGLVLLVTVALGQSFVGQPGSSFASVARLMIICCQRFPNYLNPNPSLQVSAERTGLQKGHMPHLSAAQPAPQNWTEADLRGMISSRGIVLHDFRKPFTGPCAQKARSVARFLREVPY